MEIPLLSAAPALSGRLGTVMTDRMELRPIDQSAVDALMSVFAKPEVWRYPFGRAFTDSETEEFAAAQAAHWDALGFGLWLLIDRPSSRTIGCVGLAVPSFLPELLPAVEVGWRLDPDWWGNGYATEAASVAFDEAFTTLGLSEVLSLPQVDNPRSIRVAERLGMRRTGTITAPATAKRGPVDVAMMKMTSKQWPAQRRRWGR